MPVDYFTAIDEIGTLFQESWNENAIDAVGYVPAVRWQNIQYEDKPEVQYPSKLWARLTVESADERQTTLRLNCQRFTISGLVFVQIFAPPAIDMANEYLQKLAVVARNAFRGKSTDGGIWFRNFAIKPLPPENSWLRINVAGEFEFDEISE